MKWSKFVFWNVAVILTLFGTIEGGIAWLLNNPRNIPQDWLGEFRMYYLYHDRQVLQCKPECAQFDPDLFYRLRPGMHQFNNREFKTQFTVSNAGFRDNPNDHHSPAIICLGDSHTMGWGVDDDKDYTALLEDKIGLKTLNTGVSSYGTAREFELLKSLDIDSLKYLIIQFDGNDHDENSAYYHNEGVLETSSEDTYQKMVSDQNKAITYFPFKHVSYFLRRYLEKNHPELIVQSEAEEISAKKKLPYVMPLDAFLYAVKSVELPNDVVIIVFQFGDIPNSILIEPLINSVKQGTDGISNPIIVLDMQQHLSKDHYYRLDTHLNTDGHAVVAGVLANTISELQ